MVEAVEYYELDWDNDFWKTSLYMGKPTAEGDEAWDNLWNSKLSSSLRLGLTCIITIVGEINIPFDGLHLLNKTLDDMWKLTPPQYGRGVVANFEVFHQLHCLVYPLHSPLIYKLPLLTSTILNRTRFDSTLIWTPTKPHQSTSWELLSLLEHTLITASKA